MPSSIRKALNDLPITLDDTYERMLQGIPKEKFEHASRLFQCMVAAIRPLRVEELAELFAIEFGADNVPNLVAGWRPENPEEAVLSTCSTFITIINDDDDNDDDEGSKVVQFSHFSVKEFLTSERLQMSSVGDIRQYHIPLEPAHTILARACVTVLLQVDKNVDEETFRALPLASYAVRYWVKHARFGDVVSQIQGLLVYLFDPRMSYFRPRVLLRFLDMDDATNRPPIFSNEPDKVTPLYLAVFLDFSGLAKHLITTHALDVNTVYDGFSLLHEASCNGQVNSARVLLDTGAHVNAKGYNGWTPLHYASNYGHPKLVRLLLEQGANLNARSTKQDTPLYWACDKGHLEVVQILLDHGADLNIRGDGSLTPYQVVTRGGHRGVAQLLLEHGAEGG